MGRGRVYTQRVKSRVGKRLIRIGGWLPPVKEKLIKQSEKNKGRIIDSLREVRDLKRDFDAEVASRLSQIEVEKEKTLNDMSEEERNEALQCLRKGLYGWLFGDELTGEGSVIIDPARNLGAMHINAFVDYFAKKLSELEARNGQQTPELEQRIKRNILDEIRQYFEQSIYRGVIEMWNMIREDLPTPGMLRKVFKAYKEHPDNINNAFIAFKEMPGLTEEESDAFSEVFTLIDAIDNFQAMTPYPEFLKKIMQAIVVDQFLGVKKVGEQEVANIKELHDAFAKGLVRDDALEQESMRFLFQNMFEDSLIELSKHVFDVGLRPETGIAPWMGNELWRVWTRDIGDIREKCRQAWAKDPEFVANRINPLLLDDQGRPVDRKELKWRLLEAWNVLGDLDFTKSERYEALRGFIQDHDFSQHGVEDKAPLLRLLDKKVPKKIRGTDRSPESPVGDVAPPIGE